MADGHLGKCKECAKVDVKKHRVANESVREYDRSRGNRQSLSDLQNYRAIYPLKYAAHNYVNNAVRKGKIIKPDNCESCNEKPVSTKGLHGHHDDYFKKHEVRWLCAKCHHRWHAKHGEALNPKEL